MHAVTDETGRPIRFFMTAGEVSDYTGAAALLSSMPAAQWLLADRGYDADWFREALQNKGIKPCIPGRKSRTKAVKYDKRRYKRRNSLLAHVNMLCQVIDRDYVRPSEGLAAGSNALRQMPEGVPIGSRPRRNRFVLAMKQERVLTLAKHDRPVAVRP